MIELDAVTKRYGAQLALDGVSSRFEPGRTHVLLGSSGCGKSTILRLVLGLIEPDGGTVSVDGRVMSSESRAGLLMKMGYVVQEGGLYPHLTSLQNVTLAAETRGWTQTRIRERVAELADMVEFDDAILRSYPNELSGGQRQRVSLIRALILDPPVLLLDEPLGALDPIVRSGLQRQLTEIFKRLRKTVLLVTHDITEAFVFGYTITLMTEGRILQQGSFSDLVERPASAFVAEFISAQKPPEHMQEFI